MTATTIRRTSGSIIIGLGILASAAQVAAGDHEDLDAAYNNGSVGSDWFNNVSIGGYGELHLNLNQYLIVILPTRAALLIKYFQRVLLLHVKKS